MTAKLGVRLVQCPPLARMASDSEDEVLDDLAPDDDVDGDDADTLVDADDQPDEDSASDNDDTTDDAEDDGDDYNRDIKSRRTVRDEGLRAQPMAVDVPLPPTIHPGRDTGYATRSDRLRSTPRERTLSPARARRALLVPYTSSPRSYSIEAVCAIPHPVQTHSLAASACMTHLLTGSDDGYIRDYDVYASLNSKTFLTQQQRHHCGVVEGIMKAGQLRTWWENMADPLTTSLPARADANLPESVTSLVMHSDALWGLSATKYHVALFTVRHDPGRVQHVMPMSTQHTSPISALALQADETGFFDGSAAGAVQQWDLNTGNAVRDYLSHSAQIVTIAPRPLAAATIPSHNPISSVGDATLDGAIDSRAKPDRDDDAKSDGSHDSLFDEEPDAEGEMDDLSVAGPHSQRTTGSTNSLAFPSPHGLRDGRFGNGNSYLTPTNRPIPPPLTPTMYASYSPDMLLTASIDGAILLWDRRVYSPKGVGRLFMQEKTPPWCLSACWSADGSQVYAGRRNGTVDVWDVRLMGRNGGGLPRLLKTIRNPASSGVVSCVVAFPDSRHIACASNDNIRLWNVQEAGEPETGRSKGGVQFKIIPGHHGGMISQMLIDPAARFLVTASGNRGWYGESTKTVLIHEIKTVL